MSWAWEINLLKSNREGRENERERESKDRSPFLLRQKLKPTGSWVGASASFLSFFLSFPPTQKTQTRTQSTWVPFLVHVRFVFVKIIPKRTLVARDKNFGLSRFPELVPDDRVPKLFRTEKKMLPWIFSSTRHEQKIGLKWNCFFSVGSKKRKERLSWDEVFLFLRDGSLSTGQAEKRFLDVELVTPRRGLRFFGNYSCSALNEPGTVQWLGN